LVNDTWDVENFLHFLLHLLRTAASAKIGETVPQLLKRFGKTCTVEAVEVGKEYQFRSANVSVDVVVAHGLVAKRTSSSLPKLKLR
jgi:hypothetical protein